MSRPAFDPNARTMTAPNEGEAPIQAPTEAQFGTTSYPTLPEPKSRTGAVLFVAGGALALGLLAGFFFLQERRAPRPLPAPLADVAAQAGPAPHKPALARPKKDTETLPDPSSEAELEEVPEEEPSEGEEEDEEIAATADAGAARVTGEKDAGAAIPSAAPAEADAGWEKPDWAQPDNEIPVRRGPGEEDGKIILNP
jgi:hypothetical protein